MIEQLSAPVGQLAATLCVGDNLVQRLAAVSLFTVVLAIASTVWSADQTADKSQKTAVHETIAALEECFNRGDAKGLAALWAPDGDFWGPQGERIAGRDKIEAAFQEFFAAHKNCKLQIGVVDVRLVTADVVAVDAVPGMTPAPEGLEGEPRSAILLVLRDGRWLIDSIRETVGGAPSHYGQLKDLGWMVGDWASKTDGASGVSMHSTCDWTANGSFLIRKFSIGKKDGVIERHGSHRLGSARPSNPILDLRVGRGFGESEWTAKHNRLDHQVQRRLGRRQRRFRDANADARRGEHADARIHRPHDQRAETARHRQTHRQASPAFGRAEDEAEPAGSTSAADPALAANPLVAGDRCLYQTASLCCALLALPQRGTSHCKADPRHSGGALATQARVPPLTRISHRACCHRLEQAVPGQHVTPRTASAKPWHTVSRSPRGVRNAIGEEFAAS